MDLTTLASDLSDPDVIDGILDDAELKLGYRALPYTEDALHTLEQLHSYITLAAFEAAGADEVATLDRLLIDVRDLQDRAAALYAKLSQLAADENRYLTELHHAFLRLTSDVHAGRPLSHTALWAAETFPALLPFAAATGRLRDPDSCDQHATIPLEVLLRQFTRQFASLQGHTTDWALQLAGKLVADNAHHLPQTNRELLATWLVEVEVATAFTTTYQLPDALRSGIYQPGGPGAGLNELGAALDAALGAEAASITASYHNLEMAGTTANLLTGRVSMLADLVRRGELTLPDTPGASRLFDRLAGGLFDRLERCEPYLAPVEDSASYWEQLRALLGR